MERQHFVVLIDPVGRGRKTEHPSVGDESAACGGRRARETVGRSGEKDRDASQEVERVSPVRHEREKEGERDREKKRERERQRETSTGKWESGMEGTGRESRDPHPADSYNFNHQLATLLPPRGRVICEKHVDLREEEGWPYSFISSYISCKRLSLLPRRRSIYSYVRIKGRPTGALSRTLAMRQRDFAPNRSHYTPLHFRRLSKRGRWRSRVLTRSHPFDQFEHAVDVFSRSSLVRAAVETRHIRRH